MTLTRPKLTLPARGIDRKPLSLRVPQVRGVGPPEMQLGPDWVPLWGDDFRSSNLDTTRWWTRYIYSDGTLDYLNDEWERYREEGNHVQPNTCALTAQPHNGEFWPSGMIRSKALFPIADGNAYYFECRGKVPRGLGVWPAFWLAGSESRPGDDSSCLWPPEIDMMEIPNNGDWGDTTSHLHCGCQVLNWEHNPQQYAWTWVAENFDGAWSFWSAPFNFADDFHTWGLFYRRPYFTIYCDRQPILAGNYDWVTDDRVPAPPAHILVNLAIGGSWAGRNGVDESAFPQAFEVDYVQVFKQLPQSTIGHDLMPR